jgi:hypothetical protein
MPATDLPAGPKPGSGLAVILAIQGAGQFICDLSGRAQAKHFEGE